jgi:hypothetical protein
MIEMAQRPLPKTRTAENCCLGLAECEVDRQRFEARSRRGAAHALARVLVAAGVADQPVEVRQDGLTVCIRYPSLHGMARRTYSEGNRPLRSIPYAEPEPGADRLERHKGGGEAPVPAGVPAAAPVPSLAAAHARRAHDEAQKVSSVQPRAP